VAHLLARSGVAASIRLVDESGAVAAGKALDIMQAAPIEGFSTQVSGTNDLFEAAGASLVVIADRTGRSTDAEWQGDEGLVLVGRVGQIARESVVLCAGASQRLLVERGARELSLSRDRLFGSAPEALVGALRACVGLEANVSPADVALTVLGVPPAQIIVPWEQSTIGGLSLTRILDEPACRRLAARVAPLWPPGSYALAAAAVKAIACVAGQSRESVSCFVAPDDSAGRRAHAIALPARLGPAGVIAAAVPLLSIHDRVALENAQLL
jgi:malate dehydrogenase